MQYFPVRERFAFGITSPGFNDPASASFNPALLPYDLTRGGGPFLFDAARAGLATGSFVQARTTWGAATVTGGVRYDDYRFLVTGRQIQPRVGVAYRLPGSAGVVRLSYNRNYQTPPNENLLLSSSPEAAALAPDSVRQALGGAYRPIAPERQNVYEAGYERALGSLGRGRRLRLPQGLARPAGQQQLLRHRHHLPDRAGRDTRDRAPRRG